MYCLVIKERVQTGAEALLKMLPEASFHPHFHLSVHLQLDNGISGVDALRGHTRTHPEHEG